MALIQPDATIGDAAVLSALDKLLARPAVRTSLAVHIERALARLRAAPSERLSWDTVDVSVYGGELPPEIRSSWIFVLRANTVCTAERHPNSIQRMTSLRNAGNMQTWDGSAWRDRNMPSDPQAPCLDRWISIPRHGWHRPVTAENDWIVASFHTAEAADLIEETGDPAVRGQVVVRRYEDDVPAHTDAMGLPGPKTV